MLETMRMCPRTRARMRAAKHPRTAALAGPSPIRYSSAMYFRVMLAVLSLCIACDREDLGEIEARGKDHKGDPVEALPPLEGCSELAFEAGFVFGPGHALIRGLGDLPYNSATCEALALDADGDHVVDGQAICDKRAAKSQGLAPGSTHFVTFDVGEATQCGCSCGPRSSCDNPAKYSDYDAIGAGTYADPHELYTAAQLRDIAASPDAWSRSYVQCGDIDLALNYAPNRPYFMIPEFTGDYDGQGHAIRGFTYDTAGPYYHPPTAPEQYIGLFQVLAGRVSRLDLTAVDVSALAPNLYLGGLAGHAAVTDFWRIAVDGRVAGDLHEALVGGVASTSYGSRFTDVTVDVELIGLMVGGVTYRAGGTLPSFFERIHATVDIDAGWYAGAVAHAAFDTHARDIRADGYIHTGDNAGGVFNIFMGTLLRGASDVDIDAFLNAGGLINSCYNCGVAQSRASGDIVAPEGGGLINAVAAFTPAPTYVVDSYATGSIIGGGPDGINAMGGLINTVYGDVAIARCYSSGTVTGTATYGGVAGFIGYAEGAEILDSFTTSAATGPNMLPFARLDDYANPSPVDPSNRYDSDVTPFVPNQGTPVSGATGVFFDPNTHFGWSWPTGSGGWTFTPGQLPTLTDVP